MVNIIVRIFKFLLLGVLAMVVYFAFSFIFINFPFIGALYVKSMASLGYSPVVVICFAVGFVWLYIKAFVVKPELKQSFSKQTDNGYNMFECLVSHMKDVGIKDIIAYAVFSLPWLVISLFSNYEYLGEGYMNGEAFSPYVTQIIFYEIKIPFVGYLLSIIFFALVYSAFILLFHRQWYAKKTGGKR